MRLLEEGLLRPCLVLVSEDHHRPLFSLRRTTAYWEVVGSGATSGRRAVFKSASIFVSGSEVVALVLPWEVLGRR